MAQDQDASELLHALGSQIAELRREHGMTQAELAEKVGIDMRSIQRLEAGDAAPSLARLVGLASAFGMTLGKFVLRAERVSGSERDVVGEEEVLEVWGRVPEELRGLALRIMCECAHH